MKNVLSRDEAGGSVGFTAVGLAVFGRGKSGYLPRKFPKKPRWTGINLVDIMVKSIPEESRIS
jgi:hypothetical protein